MPLDHYTDLCHYNCKLFFELKKMSDLMFVLKQVWCYLCWYFLNETLFVALLNLILCCWEKCTLYIAKTESQRIIAKQFFLAPLTFFLLLNLKTIWLDLGIIHPNSIYPNGTTDLVSRASYCTLAVCVKDTVIRYSDGFRLQFKSLNIK